MSAERDEIALYNELLNFDRKAARAWEIYIAMIRVSPQLFPKSMALTAVDAFAAIEAFDALSDTLREDLEARVAEVKKTNPAAANKVQAERRAAKETKGKAE